MNYTQEDLSFLERCGVVVGEPVPAIQMSERITIREAELPKQLAQLDVAEQERRDLAKCQVIRGHNPDAEDEQKAQLIMDRVKAFAESVYLNGVWMLAAIGAILLVVWLAVNHG